MDRKLTATHGFVLGVCLSKLKELLTDDVKCQEGIERQDSSSNCELACSCQGITAWKKAVMPSSPRLLANLGLHTVC